MDESLVALMLMLNLKPYDILYNTADMANQCFYNNKRCIRQAPAKIALRLKTTLNITSGMLRIMVIIYEM